MRHVLGLSAAAASAVTLLALGGCGQKGPLYLPEKGAAVVRPPPATAAPAPQTPTSEPAATPPSAAPVPGETAPQITPATQKKADEDSDSQPPQP